MTNEHKEFKQYRNAFGRLFCIINVTGVLEIGKLPGYDIYHIFSMNAQTTVSRFSIMLTCIFKERKCCTLVSNHDVILPYYGC